MSEIENKIVDAKETLTKNIPTPEPQQIPVSSPKALKERLEWGEPALTIIDVRDRQIFNDEHITGAITAPLEDLIETVKSNLEFNRDIYVYGGDDQETAQAASQLREAGFTSVSEIEGGLDGWKAIAGQTDGRTN